MFSSFGMGSAIDTYTVELGYEIGVRSQSEGEKVEFKTTVATFDTTDDPEDVIDRLVKAREELPYVKGQDYVVIRTLFSASKVAIQLGVQKFQPKPVGLKVSSSTKTSVGKPHNSLVKILKHCQLDVIRDLIVQDGLAPIVFECRDRWASVRSLDVSNNNLELFPKDLFTHFPFLKVLRLDGNKLTTLPALNSLTMLREFHAANNQIATVPVDLVEDLALEVLSLEYNRLTKLHIKFKNLSKLRVLKLLENPIETLPRLNKSSNQQFLSIANVQINRNVVTGRVDVEVKEASSSYFASIVGSKATQKGKAFNAFLSLIFRSEESRNALLISAVARIACMGPEYSAAIVGVDGAVNQLIDFVCSTNVTLVHHASRTLAQLCSVPHLARSVLCEAVFDTILKLIQDHNNLRNRSGLIILNGLVESARDVSRACYSTDLLDRLVVFVQGFDEELRLLSLRILGTFAFDDANRRDMLKTEKIHSVLVTFALRPELKVASAMVQREAIRMLAILGENDLVRQATGVRPITGRGVRILAMDGGGIRGRATVKLLKRIEEGTGRPIHESFDLVCGTSTGAVLAVASCIKRVSLDHCDDIYLKLGRKIFSQTTHDEETNGVNSWLGSVGSMYNSGKQQLLATTLYSSKHDTSTFETLVKQECKTEDSDPSWIDTASLGGPKVCCVSTLTSDTPARPFLFRNYQYPATCSGPEHSQQGSCSQLLWEGVCASAAAPYYLYVDAFERDSQRWVDGAMTCNNPAMVGISEARRLWPDKQIECVVSLGSGTFEPHEREPPISLVALAKDVLFDSACDTERVHESLETLLPLLPGASYYRFNPVDERCKIEVDETDIGALQGLIDATSDYITTEKDKFDQLCELLRDVDDDVDEVTAILLDTEISSSRQQQGVLVLESPRYEGELSEHSMTIANFCKLRSIPMEHVDCWLNRPEPYSGTMIGTLDSLVQRSDAAVVHFNCYSDVDGLILSWQEDMSAIAEPSTIADLFLEKAAMGYYSLSELTESESHVEVQGVLHTFAGKHVQVRESGERTSAYLFKRTVPLEYLDETTSRKLFSLWRGKLIVSQTPLPPELARTWLEAGAKCVVAPSFNEESSVITSALSEFMAAFYHALFVVGADAAAAMSAAAIVQPACAYFRCYVLVDGTVVTLRPDEEFDFHLDAHI